MSTARVSRWAAPLAAVCLALSGAAAQDATRGVRPKKTSDGAVHGEVAMANGATESIPFGHYHALLIGINGYRDRDTWSSLDTPANDVHALRDVLVSAYGFEPSRIVTLLDEQATRSGILVALEEYARVLDYDKDSGRDNLLIYFAGHGVVRWKDRFPREGFWIPWDADGSWPTWVTGSTLQRMIQRIRAKVLVVSDSCFSGDVFRGSPTPAPERTLRLFVAQSRQYLTSGQSEPVPDGGPEGHSVFAYHLLDFLRHPPGDYPMAVELFSHLFRRLGMSGTTPALGHVGERTDGQFVFTLVNPDVVSQSAQDLAVQPGLPPGYRLPRNVEQIAIPVGENPDDEFGRYRYRITKGPDAGTEMVLVPGGRFRPGVGQPEIEVEPFLIDRCEVTFERFEHFLEAHHDYPFPGIRTRGLKRTGIPMVQVSLEDARAFAKWAGKQLPTVAQWQFAAWHTGEEGRPPRGYAWGDQLAGQLPTKLEWTPMSVDEPTRTGDRSYWGVHGMTGGVREWCINLQSQDRGIAVGGRRVQAARGEAWSPALLHPAPTPLPSTKRLRWLGFRCVTPLRR